MTSRIKYLLVTAALSACTLFLLPGCAHLQRCDISTHAGGLAPDYAEACSEETLTYFISNNELH